VNMVEEARDPQLGASRKSSANELAGIRPAYMHEVGDFSEPRKRRRGQSSHQMCITPGCSRVAVRGGKPGLCITHGGGRRCKHEAGCTKAAQGSTHFCISHGGGRRCGHRGCDRAARGATLYCYQHTKEKRSGLAVQLRLAVKEEFPSFVVENAADDGDTFT
jgi:hypothetical protein